MGLPTQCLLCTCEWTPVMQAAGHSHLERGLGSFAFPAGRLQVLNAAVVAPLNLVCCQLSSRIADARVLFIALPAHSCRFSAENACGWCMP